MAAVNTKQKKDKAEIRVTIGDAPEKTKAQIVAEMQAGYMMKDRLLRPLTILALSVRDISGPKLLWHALTGR